MEHRNHHRGAGSKIGRSIGSAVGGAIDAAVHTAGAVGKAVLSPFRARVRPGDLGSLRAAPGAPPGIESVGDVNTPPPPGTIGIQCIDYSRDRIDKTHPPDVESLLGKPRPDWVAVRWINIDGLHPYVVSRIMKAFGLHTLAAEDVLHVHQRPKVDPFEGELFIITRMPELQGDVLLAEQVSIFYRPDLIVSFQERPGDVWDPVRQRLERPTSRLRLHDGSFLLHALLDATVDQCFPILEHYGDELEEMEAILAGQPTAEFLRRLHGIKRHLAHLRRVMWPMREVMNDLQREELKVIPKAARAYFRDIYDHAVQVIDLLENYREMAGGLTDLYMSAISNRMNEVMKILTIMATLFIPITFLAGVYGMNFDYFPELHWRYAYPAFWGVCIVVVVSLLIWFKRKGWLG